MYRVYLSGPIDYVDGRQSWKDYVMEKCDRVLNNIDYIDPLEEWTEEEYKEQPGAAVEWCLEMVRKCDVFILGGWTSDVVTRGTMREYQVAYSEKIPVIVLTNENRGDLSPFVREDASYVVDNYTAVARAVGLSILLNEEGYERGTVGTEVR